MVNTLGGKEKNTFKTMGAFFFSSIYVLKCLFTITTEKETLFQRIFTMLGRLEFVAKCDEFELGPAACERMGTRCPLFYFSHVVVIYAAFQ